MLSCQLSGNAQTDVASAGSISTHIDYNKIDSSHFSIA